MHRDWQHRDFNLFINVIRVLLFCANPARAVISVIKGENATLVIRDVRAKGELKIVVIAKNSVIADVSFVRETVANILF